MRETITLDARAQRRLYVLNHVLGGGLTLAEAAAYLEVSERQVRRLLADRTGEQGAAVLIHGNRGRRPVNRLTESHRARLVELASTSLVGSDPAHLAETLAEEPALAVSARSVRRPVAVRAAHRWPAVGPGCAPPSRPT